MKFTILSHAGLCVEHNGIRIVSDPWLVGSCYWRSWWNFPEPPAALIENLNADYVYLTHLHWDHFHGPSLKKLFAPSTRFLVPKVPTRRMVEDLNWLGFHDVTETPHGGSLQLGLDFTLHSFQFGTGVDSAMVLTGGGRTLLNTNDCKSFGLPLRQITKRFPKVDFVLRSHSSAGPIPYCVEGYESAFPHLRSQQDYIDEFSRFALHVGARYAIPFASNHCFLHRDTFRFNRTAVSAEDVKPPFDRLVAQLGSSSECVVMAPGSSWSEQDGFQIVPFDYSNRDAYLQGLLTRHEAALTAQYEKEAATEADFGTFTTYFGRFLKSIPWLLRRALGLRVVFRTRDRSGEHNWLVDIAAGKVVAVSGAVEDCVVIEMPALVLNDCTTLRMFSVWTASKRLIIHLREPQQLQSAMRLFTLLDLYELDTFPLRRNLSVRALGVRLRRWREAVEMCRLVLKHVVLRRPFEISELYTLPRPSGAQS